MTINITDNKTTFFFVTWKLISTLDNTSLQLCTFSYHVFNCEMAVHVLPANVERDFAITPGLKTAAVRYMPAARHRDFPLPSYDVMPISEHQL